MKESISKVVVMFCMMMGVRITQVSTFIRIHVVIHVIWPILSIPKYYLKKEPETSGQEEKDTSSQA